MNSSTVQHPPARKGGEGGFHRKKGRHRGEPRKDKKDTCAGAPSKKNGFASNHPRNKGKTFQKGRTVTNAGEKEKGEKTRSFRETGKPSKGARPNKKTSTTKKTQPPRRKGENSGGNFLPRLDKEGRSRQEEKEKEKEIGCRGQRKWGRRLSPPCWGRDGDPIVGKKERGKEGDPKLLTNKETKEQKKKLRGHRHRKTVSLGVGKKAGEKKRKRNRHQAGNSTIMTLAHPKFKKGGLVSVSPQPTPSTPGKKRKKSTPDKGGYQ